MYCLLAAQRSPDSYIAGGVAIDGNGQPPEEMLAGITRHSRFTAEEFRVFATERPIDVPDLHRRIRGMPEGAQGFIAHIPSGAVGVVFLERGNAVQPDLNALEQYQRHTGSVGGVWPSSPEISSAMLERYEKQNGNGCGLKT